MLSKEEIKIIRSLTLKKFRESHQLFVIEGEKMIDAALEFCPTNLLQIIGTEEYPTTLPPSIDQRIVTEKVLQQVSALQHPRKWIGICQFLIFPSQKSDFIIAVDTVQDPGNFGTILRLASWFGVQHVIASKETVDSYNPKVVQSSMGAIFNVKTDYLNLKDFLSETKLPIYAALMDGESIYQQQLFPKGILLVGNEGKGISQDLLPLVTHKISIPKLGKGESLNVAMATSIFLSEFFRRTLD